MKAAKIAAAAIMLVAAGFTAIPAQAMPLNEVVDTISAAGGAYARGLASLPVSDCSGLVSVAQSLAMGEQPHRFGDTYSLLAGQWADAIPGASHDDAFVIGTSPTHMVASLNGVNIESTGGRYRVGASAASPWDAQFSTRFHIDPVVLQ